MANYIQQFEGTGALHLYLTTTPRRKEVWGERTVVDNDNYMKKWAKCTIEEGLELLDKGDKKAAAKIKAEGEILAEANSGARLNIVPAVVGCLPCVPNFLRGVPTSMLKVVNTPREMPVIDIFVCVSVYDGINTKKVAEKAAMLANVITATEISGVRVNLWAVSGMLHDNGNRYGFIVSIKDADAPLNLLNIAFALTNMGFSRTLSLLYLEQVCEERDGGYGIPLSAKAAKEAIGRDGLYFSIKDMVMEDEQLKHIEQRVNEYLASRNAHGEI